MLYDYVERKRKENSGAQLHVTYLVSGSLIHNGHSVSSQNLIVSLNVFELLIVLCNITQGKNSKIQYYGNFKKLLEDSGYFEFLD